MTEISEAKARAQWDAMNPTSKENLLRVVRNEAEAMMKLASVPENWESPTPCGHWQVRDIVGHMVDVTEGYLAAFRMAREGEVAPPPFGLLTMAERLDANALDFRSVSQDDLLARLEALPGTLWVRDLRLTANSESDNTLRGELTLTIFVDRTDSTN